MTEHQFDNQLKAIFKTGSLFAIIVILGTLADIVAGSIFGGDLTAIPVTAADRFAQFRENTLLGLYDLDLLNLTTALLMVPVFVSLFSALHKYHAPLAMLSLVIFIIGTAIFVANNSALPMLDLSHKFASSSDESVKMQIAAAGEAMLVKGAHGSLGVFPGFILINISEILISCIMLKTSIFSKTTAYAGVAGNSLLFIYILLLTFIPAMKSIAMMIAGPGGLLTITWMILFTVKLYKLGR